MAKYVIIILRIFLVTAMLFYCQFGLPASVQAFENYLKYAPYIFGLSDLLFALTGTGLLIAGLFLLFNIHLFGKKQAIKKRVSRHKKG